MLTELFHSLDYRLRGWAFGHFHTKHEHSVEGTDFVCPGELDQSFVAIRETALKKILILKRPEE